MSKFMDAIKSESKKYGAGAGNSDFFKFEEGIQKIRIATEPEVIAYHFFGEGQRPDVCIGIDEGCPHHKEGTKRPTIKLCTYVIDRKDGKVKFAELPLSISYAINDLQQDQDFAFEGFPMPFDVKITYEPKNPDPKAKYRLVASPKQETLTADEDREILVALEKMTPEKYVQIRKDKQLSLVKQKPEYPEGDPDAIPF
jgi:hypothetical protein